MTTEDTSSSPAVALARHALAEAIQRGIYAPSSRLPGERELAAQIGVSRTTLRHALLQLADDGVVQSSSQRGWFVSSRMLGEPPSVLQSFTEMARTRGLNPITQVLSQRVRPSTFEEAARLAVAPSSRVLELKRRRSLGDVPVCVDTNIIAVGVDALDALDFTDRSLYEALKEACGVTMARCAYTVQAVAATGELTELLDIAEGSPLLSGQEITFALDGSAISTGTTIYRGDAYRFQADLFAPLA